MCGAIVAIPLVHNRPDILFFFLRSFQTMAKYTGIVKIIHHLQFVQDYISSGDPLGHGNNDRISFFKRSKGWVDTRRVKQHTRGCAFVSVSELIGVTKAVRLISLNSNIVTGDIDIL